MNESCFTKSFSSEISLVKSITKEIMRFLSENLIFMNEEDYLDLKLIYNELLLNAVIHGNHGNPEKKVRLTIELMDKNLICSTIEDEGKGFDYKKFLQSSPYKSNLFLESGRGITLVHGLVDSILYNNSGNQITFYKRVKKNG